MKGTFRICGEYKKLSYEYTSPEAAFNNSPMYIQKSEHLHDKKSFIYGKRILSNRGAGSYSLCVSCNTSTGGLYGESFKQFAYQGAMSCTHREWSKELIPFVFQIKPLNVLKQILTMFMSIDKSDHLLKMDGLSDFILDKNSNSLLKKMRVFIYYTNSVSVRNGWGLLANISTQKTIETGEITFRPFGYIYTIDAIPFVKNVFEITHWKNYKYDKKDIIFTELPYLMPRGYVPGVYV